MRTCIHSHKNPSWQPYCVKNPRNTPVFHRIFAFASEALVATYCGMQGLSISCITNMAAGVLDQKLDHKEVVETANRVKKDFTIAIEEKNRKKKARKNRVLLGRKTQE